MRSLRTRPGMYASLVILGAALATVNAFAPSAHAQVGLLGIERSVSIQMSPQYPEPGDTVTLTVTSPIVNLSTAQIDWSTGGKTIAQGVGVTSAQVTLGELGSRSIIDVSATAGDGTATGRIIIIPTELDVLTDSDSYVPPFYRGRALASVGTSMLIEVRPHFILPDGTSVPSNDIAYTWRKNDDIMTNLTGKGKSSARIPIEHLYGSDTISVEATTDDRVLSNKATIPLSPVKPLVLLYQDHPLFGVMYYNALKNKSVFSENEVAFAAVPYYTQARNADDPYLTYAWRVNGHSIPENSANPSSITINADNSTGAAFVELELTHKTNYFLDAQNSWNLSLSSTKAPSAPTDFGKFGPQI